MVDTTTIDLPSATPPPRLPSMGNTAFPDVAEMLKELQIASVLEPELVPQTLQSITSPTLAVAAQSPQLSPIQLATTTTEFTRATQPATPTQTWKWLSWFFLGLSVLVLSMVLFSLWQQGLKIEVTTEASANRPIFKDN